MCTTPCPIGDLRGPLVVDQVERTEGKPWKRGPDRAVRRSIGSRSRSVGTLEPGPASGPSPSEQLPDLPPDRPERPSGTEVACDGAPELISCTQPREVVRVARRGRRPHVLVPEIGGELMYPPGPGGVRGVRKPHSLTASAPATEGSGLRPSPGGLPGSTGRPCSSPGTRPPWNRRLRQDDRDALTPPSDGP